MKLNKNTTIKKMFLILIVVTLFFAAIMVVSSDEEKVKYSELEKEEIGEDDESQEALREYYGDILGSVKKNAKFNTIATQGDIVVLNVTINGKDTRILTRLRTATLFPTQNLLNATLIRTINLIVLGNISLKGNLFFEVEKSFGLRRLYDVKSTNSRYVDEGFARLVNGNANISINPVLRELISSYNVFMSVEGRTQGIYIAEKTSSYFVVKSVNSGSNVGFSWMLRGIKKKLDEQLSSEYGKEQDIVIKAEINFENGITVVKITGLDNILKLVNLTSDDTSVNQSDNLSITLITGNLIDEFGLETDLGSILSDPVPTLPSLEEDNDVNNNVSNNESNVELNSTVIPDSSELEYILSSTDEDIIINQVSEVTGLSLGQVKKLINFVYLEPIGFEDEVIEDQLSLDFIEKINGSVIIRLG